MNKENKIENERTQEQEKLLCPKACVLNQARRPPLSTISVMEPYFKFLYSN
jgi:hypothetical protein